MCVMTNICIMYKDQDYDLEDFMGLRQQCCSPGYKHYVCESWQFADMWKTLTYNLIIWSKGIAAIRTTFINLDTFCWNVRFK